MHSPRDRIFRREMTRRDFLWLASMAGSSAALSTLLGGCAADPVTGRSELVGLDEQEEIRIDRVQAPQQFSSDYGATQDEALNRYVGATGAGLWTRSHRPQMPYSARVVNANYVNAYTFPAGSIAVSRGIMLEMKSEDELAALLGHEIGHVNARHAAERAGRGQLAQYGSVAAQIGLTLIGVSPDLARAAGQLSAVGASALLASYSRENEREADALGMEYMTRGGYNAEGMVVLMDVLNREAREQPSMIETMFASHPMSAERYETAKREAAAKYAASRSAELRRQRYMDATARLRAIEPAIRAQQRGETALAKESIGEAEQQFAHSLALAPNDYTGLVLMAQTKIAQKRYAEAEPYVDRAVSAYPTEGQALKLGGIVKLTQKRPEQAYQRFEAYGKAMPGDASTPFFKGIAKESMQDRAAAAQHYAEFLRAGGSGQQGQYARQRLQEWGVIR